MVNDEIVYLSYLQQTWIVWEVFLQDPHQIMSIATVGTLKLGSVRTGKYTI